MHAWNNGPRSNAKRGMIGDVGWIFYFWTPFKRTSVIGIEAGYKVFVSLCFIVIRKLNFRFLGAKCPGNVQPNENNTKYIYIYSTCFLFM